MFGSTTLTPARLDYDPEDAPGSYTPESVTINVQRMVSRIDVVKVAVDFSAKPHLAAKTFTLRGLYLTNVYRTARYGSDYAFSELSATRTAWYNTGGWHRGESADAGIDALASNTGINVVIDGSTPYNVKNSFYAYPNATPIGSDMHAMGSWYRRCTRIIIEADMDGTVMYYQVNVPSMERNHIYSVSNIVIKGLGSKDPEVVDYYEDGESVSYSIETSDWDGEYSVTEESYSIQKPNISMKFNSIISTLALGTVFLFSCQKETDYDLPEPPVPGERLEFSIEEEDPETVETKSILTDASIETKRTGVTVGVYVKCQGAGNGAWGKLDDATLNSLQ